MKLSFQRPLKQRSVMFKDGHFVSVHQTKASRHLATQKETKQNKPMDPGVDPVEVEDLSQHPISDLFEQKLSPIGKQIATLLFLGFLMSLCFAVLTLGQLFWRQSQAYFLANPISPIEIPFIGSLGSGDGQIDLPIVNDSSSLHVDLTYMLHVQQTTIKLYEDAKAITRTYVRGETTAGERSIALKQLLNEIDETLNYTQTRKSESAYSSANPFYLTTYSRLEHLKSLIVQLNEAPYRGLSLEQLNRGIEADAPFFTAQLQAFKDFLNHEQIDYTEIDGKLYVSFSNN